MLARLQTMNSIDLKPKPRYNEWNLFDQDQPRDTKRPITGSGPVRKIDNPLEDSFELDRRAYHIGVPINDPSTMFQ